MAYSAEHRFKKRYNIHYSYKLDVRAIHEACGIPMDELKQVYDFEFARSGKPSLALAYVYSYCNGARAAKEYSSMSLEKV